MIAVIQRVTKAHVAVNDKIIAQIDRGMMALIAIEKRDTEKQAERMVQRLLNYRIFPDQDERMNLSLQDIAGGLLLVPQFTLAADTNQGNRPSFTPAATPEKGRQLFATIMKLTEQKHQPTEFGRFGADMQITLTNDGPVTFILTS
jgi:D-tyrosyl-tRNA(Tyr) deacylase